MKRLSVIASIVVLVVAGLVLASAPVEAQQKGKKGQSAKIQHGIVVKTERIDLSENKAPKGALVGGSIGLVTGGSSGYNRRRSWSNALADRRSAIKRSEWSLNKGAPS